MSGWLLPQSQSHCFATSAEANCLLCCCHSGAAPAPLTCSARVQLRAPRTNGARRIAEAVGLGLFTIAVMFTLSWLFGACVDVPEWHTVSTLDSQHAALLPVTLMTGSNLCVRLIMLAGIQSYVRVRILFV